jgi:hypothetical protein
VDPARADAYAEVGRRLLLAGRAILERGDTRHASGLAILSVHAGIAYGDAVCILRGGRKSASADHAATLRLLRAILGDRLPDAMSRTLQRLLADKDRFEYQGLVVTMRDASAAFEAAERFGAWAENLLAGAP